MEALKLKPVVMLAKCEPVLPSSGEVASWADSICRNMVRFSVCTGSALPAADDGFLRYLDKAELWSLACDPDGEWTAAGRTLLGMFIEAWNEALPQWKVEGLDVD